MATDLLGSYDDLLLRQFMAVSQTEDNMIDRLNFIISVPELIQCKYDSGIRKFTCDGKTLINKQNLLPELVIMVTNILADVFNGTDHTTNPRDVVKRLTDAKGQIIEARRKRMMNDKCFDDITESLCNQINDMINFFHTNQIGNPHGVTTRGNELVQSGHLYFLKPMCGMGKSIMLSKDVRPVEYLIDVLYPKYFGGTPQGLVQFFIDNIFMILGCALYHGYSFGMTSSRIKGSLFGSFGLPDDLERIQVYWGSEEDKFGTFFILAPLVYNYMIYMKDNVEREFVINLDNEIIEARNNFIKRQIEIDKKEPKQPIICAVESMRANELKEAMESVFETVSEIDIQHREIDYITNSFKERINNL